MTNASPAVNVFSHPPGGDPGTALAMARVAQRWPGTKEALLQDLDLVLPRGTVSRLTGRNGVGKTTLLRIAAGLIQPSSGSVTVFDADPFRDRRRYQRLTAYVPAGSIGLYARLSPRQHLEFEARLGLMPPQRRRSAVERGLERFGLREVASRRADRLSMGQRQRVRLALAMVNEPRVLLLDEPLSSLDDEGVELLRATIEETVADGGAVIWCSPHEDALGFELDQSLVLEQGRVWAG